MSDPQHETGARHDDPVDTVVVDVDGTLVDTVYQHTRAWAVAFAALGVDVPSYRIHRAIGMGGDRLVAEVAGDDVERRCGDDLRERHGQEFGAVIDDVRPLPGAAELLAELKRRGLNVVIASSGEPEQTARLLEKVGGDRTSDDRTTSGDVEASKPAPDLIEVAIEKVAGSRAAVVGDAVWDIAAAQDQNRYCVGLLTGGFGEGELREAGADRVYATPQALLEDLDATPLRGVAG